VTATNDKDGFCRCNCMEGTKRGWRWPSNTDALWYSIDNVDKKIDQPTPVSAREVYKFEEF